MRLSFFSTKYAHPTTNLLVPKRLQIKEIQYIIKSNVANQRKLSHFLGNAKDLVNYTNRAKILENQWSTIANQHAFMEDLAKTLNIKDKNEWYTIDRKTLKRYAHELMQLYHHSPYKLLSTVYSEYLHE